MKKIAELAVWLVILGGLLLGWEALTGRDVLATLAGRSNIDILVKGAIGVAALLVLGGRIKK